MITYLKNHLRIEAISKRSQFIYKHKLAPTMCLFFLRRKRGIENTSYDQGINLSLTYISTNEKWAQTHSVWLRCTAAKRSLLLRL